MSIILDHVNYIYDSNQPTAKKALDDVCLTIPDGQFLGIIGHTGSGKSTPGTASERSVKGYGRPYLRGWGRYLRQGL